MRATSSI